MTVYHQFCSKCTYPIRKNRDSQVVVARLGRTSIVIRALSQVALIVRASLSSTSSICITSRQRSSVDSSMPKLQGWILGQLITLTRYKPRAILRQLISPISTRRCAQTCRSVSWIALLGQRRLCYLVTILSRLSILKPRRLQKLTHLKLQLWTSMRRHLSTPSKTAMQAHSWVSFPLRDGLLVRIRNLAPKQWWWKQSSRSHSRVREKRKCWLDQRSSKVSHRRVQNRTSKMLSEGQSLILLPIAKKSCLWLYHPRGS